MVIFHMEYKINFIISIVTTHARMKFLVLYTFLHFSELPCLLLVGGKVVLKKNK